MTSLTFNQLVAHVKQKHVYMLIGNGSKNQFRDLRKINGILTAILKTVPSQSVFLYFGDAANKKKPDVGLLFQLIKKRRPDIKIFMIQIREAKSWGVPDFVSDVYWHTDYTKKCKWGGLLKGKPCSNTKKWVSLNKRIRGGIRGVFILGGGAITLDEYSLLKKNNIPYLYFPVKRKFKGDGKTRTTNKDSMATQVGVTYHKIH